jgi:hypothetical protein
VDTPPSQWQVESVHYAAVQQRLAGTGISNCAVQLQTIHGHLGCFSIKQCHWSSTWVCHVLLPPPHRCSASDFTQSNNIRWDAACLWSKLCCNGFSKNPTKVQLQEISPLQLGLRMPVFQRALNCCAPHQSALVPTVVNLPAQCQSLGRLPLCHGIRPSIHNQFCRHSAKPGVRKTSAQQ